jgi:hypothetical protein
MRGRTAEFELQPLAFTVIPLLYTFYIIFVSLPYSLLSASERGGAMAATNERDMFEIARAAANARDSARHEMREHIFRERQRLASMHHDSRVSIGQGLLSSTGMREAELDSIRRLEEERIRALREERRAIAARSPMAGNDQHRPIRGSPFPDSPQLGYKLIQLDTATFIGPPVNDTGSNSRTLVAPEHLYRGTTSRAHSSMFTLDMSRASISGATMRRLSISSSPSLLIATFK